MVQHTQRVFSGIQPTGQLHIGNYYGAIKQWLPLQEKMECIFCIVDYHAITVYQDPQALKNAIIQTAATYIACGIDPEKSLIYAQSSVPQHTELAWILGCK
jgi:tryptophanyl-tRNA synthetase